jgi:hypothetical protein
MWDDLVARSLRDQPDDRTSRLYYHLFAGQARLGLARVLPDPQDRRAEVNLATRFIEEAAREEPKNADLALEHACAEDLLGDLDRQARSLSEARDHYQKALALREPIAKEYTEPLATSYALAISRLNLARTADPVTAESYSPAICQLGCVLDRNPRHFGALRALHDAEAESAQRLGGSREASR